MQTVQGVAWFSENEGTKIAQCYFKHTDSPSKITKHCSDNASKRGARETNTQKDKNEAQKNQHVPETLLIYLFIQFVSSQSKLANLCKGQNGDFSRQAHTVIPLYRTFCL